MKKFSKWVYLALPSYAFFVSTLHPCQDVIAEDAREGLPWSPSDPIVVTSLTLVDLLPRVLLLYAQVYRKTSSELSAWWSAPVTMQLLLCRMSCMFARLNLLKTFIWLSLWKENFVSKCVRVCRRRAGFGFVGDVLVSVFLYQHLFVWFLGQLLRNYDVEGTDRICWLCSDSFLHFPNCTKIK